MALMIKQESIRNYYVQNRDKVDVPIYMFLQNQKKKRVKKYHIIYHVFRDT